MKSPFRKLPLRCALALVCLCVAVQAAAQLPAPVPNRVAQAPDNAVRVTLPGNVHPLARVELSRGPVADALPMSRILLLLKRSDAQEAALQSLLEAQQEKSSPNYHKWLAPEEFGKQFGPSDADLQAVTDWLTAQGFHDIRVGAGRNVIEFSGSAGQVRQAFSTQIQNYAVNGKMYVANSSDPQIPAALAPVVSGVVSLHNFPRKSHTRYVGDVRKDSTSGKLQPLFTFPDPFNSGQNFYGVGPGDFATIYNSKPLVGSGNDGTGQTIAIVGETQINPSDVVDFRTMFGLTNNFPASNIVLNGMDPGITSQDEESEADLDAQWSGAVAPGATVKYVVSASTPASAGIDLSALYIVEHNLADVMSESYGDCESDLGSAGNTFYNALWEQAAAQGITVVVASGDGGSAGCDNFNAQPPAPATHGLAVSGIAGTPFNVSVGGTDFNQVNVWSNYWNTTNDSVTGTSAKSYIPEFPWNENCSQLGLTGCGSTAPQGSVNIVAGGGGPSSIYAKPAWQMGVTGVPNDNHRDQPDISLFASTGFTGSGYLFCQKDLTHVPSCNLNSAGYTFHVIGGTSASAPAFAGIMALVNQYAAAHGGTSRQGNANINLYALAKQPGASCASSAAPAAGCIFNDIVAGNSQFANSVPSNSVACQGGSPNCSSSVASVNGVLVDPNHTTTEAWTATAGYDLTTGLGTLNVNNLAAKWATASTIATTTTLSLSPTTGITHGTTENVSVTINVKPNTGTGVPSGDVALMATLADGSKLGVDQFTLANGAVTGAKTQSLPGGTYNVYAHYAGDGTNAPSDSASVQVTVGKESSQTFIVIPTFDSQGKQTSGNANSVIYGSNYIIRMYVTNSSATPSASGPPSPTCYQANQETCPTGSIALTSGGTPVDGGTFTLNNNGYTRDIAPTLTGGTYSLVANYAGDNSYTASTSATDGFTVTPAATSQQWTYYPNTTVIGQPFSLGVSVGTGVAGVAPTGAVTFYDGNTALAGNVTYSAQGVGNNVVLYASGTFSLSKGGSHTITAKYSGDANYGPSTSSPVTTVALYPTAISQSESATAITYGQTITVSVKVTSTSTGPPMTGQIQFNAGPYGTVANAVTVPGTDSSGNQMLTATATVNLQGTSWVSANYYGDANYTPSATSGDLITVNIPDFSLPLNTVITVTAGQSQSSSITITPLSNTASPVALSAMFTPSGVSLTFNPNTVNLNGSPVPVPFTVSVTGPSGGPTGNLIKAETKRAMVPVTTRDFWPFGLAGILALLTVAIRSRSFLRYGTALFACALGILVLSLGCGGGGSPSGGGNGGSGGSASGPTPTTITLTTSNAKVPSSGGSFTLTATVISSSGKPLTGTVLFSGAQMSFPYPNGAPLVNGKASYIVQTNLPPGTYNYTAQYSGDANNLDSRTTTGINEVFTGTTQATYAAQTGALSHQGVITINLQ